MDVIRSTAIYAIGASILLSSGLAHAEDGFSMMAAYSATVAGFYELGSGEFGGYRTDTGLNPTVAGLRYYERSGLITGFTAGLIAAMGGSMAAAGPKSVKTWEDQNYRYTETTYYSEAEKAEMNERTAASAASMAAASNQTFDLEIYTRELGDASGYKVNFLFGIAFDDYALLSFGLGWANVKTETRDGDNVLQTNYKYLGMPFRLDVPVSRFILFTQFDWNWWGHDEDRPIEVVGTTTFVENNPFPLRLGLATNIFGRVYLEAYATTPDIGSSNFAARANAGVRF